MSFEKSLQSTFTPCWTGPNPAACIQSPLLDLQPRDNQGNCKAALSKGFRAVLLNLANFQTPKKRHLVCVMLLPKAKLLLITSPSAISDSCFSLPALFPDSFVPLNFNSSSVNSMTPTCRESCLLV